MRVTVCCMLGLEKMLHQFPEYVHILYVCGILKKTESTRFGFALCKTCMVAPLRPGRKKKTTQIQIQQTCFISERNK